MASPYRNAYNAAYSSSSSSSSSSSNWESPGVSLVEKARKSITTTQEYVARVATPSSNPALNAGIWVVAFTVAAACVKLAMPALPETSQAKKDDINRSARRVDRGANSVSISERIQLLGETVTNRLLGEENANSRQPRIADAKQRPAASNLSGRDEACAVASNNAAELQESQAALYRGALSNSDLAMFDLRFIAVADVVSGSISANKSDTGAGEVSDTQTTFNPGKVNVASVENYFQRQALIHGHLYVEGGMWSEPSFRETEVLAHRAVLAISAPLRQKMVALEPKHTKITTIELPTTPGWALRAAVDYVYTGRTADLTNDRVLMMCAVATQLGLSTLEQLCTRRVISRISVDTCARWLAISSKLDLQEPSKVFDEYARANFESVAQTPDFLRLPMPLVRSLLSAHDLNTPTGEEAVFDALLHWTGANMESPELVEEACNTLLPLVRFPLMRSANLVALKSRVSTKECPVLNALYSSLEPLLLEAVTYQLASSEERDMFVKQNSHLQLLIKRRTPVSSFGKPRAANHEWWMGPYHRVSSDAVMAGYDSGESNKEAAAAAKASGGGGGGAPAAAASYR